MSVPAEARNRNNTVAMSEVTIAAGQSLFVQKCAICPGYDGSGRTEIGSGEYPHPPDLRSSDIQNMTDGELFYVIQNGIRYTGMRAWTLPDEDVWRIVSFIRQLAHRPH
jgi:Cytochrome c